MGPFRHMYNPASSPTWGVLYNDSVIKIIFWFSNLICSHRNISCGLSSWQRQPTMSCRDIHATNAFALIVAIVCVGGITVATLIPQWRITRLVTFNRNAKNVTVYDGLWAKCVKQDGYTGCYYYDSEVLFNRSPLGFSFFLHVASNTEIPFSYFFSGTIKWTSWI